MCRKSLDVTATNHDFRHMEKMRATHYIPAMRSSPSSTRLLLFAGLMTWFIAIVTSLSEVLRHGSLVPWAIALAGFALAFVIGIRREKGMTTQLLAGQTVAALVVVALSPSSTASALFAVTAGQLPFLYSFRKSAIWMSAQTLGMVVIYVHRWGAGSGVIVSASFFAFEAFALGAATLAQRESEARLDLARTNAELLATRELATDATRIAERLRISGELHDSLGHHLTALSLNIELLRNVAEGRAKEPVDRAHAITKELLRELREVVSAMREEEPMNLGRALEILARGIPTPTIHLRMQTQVVHDHAVAHTLFRCAQESVTNAVRHAGARNVWVDLSETEESFIVVIRDDGRAVLPLVEGNGISGLRTRVHALGGLIDWKTEVGKGIVVSCAIPMRKTKP